MRRPWFGVKTYGYGIGPSRPAGWAVMAAYLVLMAAVPLGVAALHLPRVWGGVGVALVTASLLVVMILTGDGKRWRWRWGGRPGGAG